MAGVFFAACSAIQSDYRYKGGGSSDSGSSSGGSGGSSGGGSSSDQGGSGDVTPDVPTSDEITIRYDYGAASSFFGTLDEITLYETIKTNVGIVKLPMIKSQYSDAFLGWFNVSTDEKVKIGDKPQTDIDVYAKFDVDKRGLAGLFENGRKKKKWDDIKRENPNAFFGTAIMSNGGDSYFTNLKGDLIIDSEITEIQAYAFSECELLTSVVIPDSVTTIGEHAFDWCSKLENLKIGKGVTSIGELAFAGGLVLKNVYYNAISCYTVSSSAYIFMYIGQYTDGGCTITIGKDVTCIPNNFCRCDSVENSANYDAFTNLIFEDVSSLSEIGTYAFRNCTSLNNVTFPNSLTTIGQYAFNGCSAFTNVTIPQNVTIVGKYAFGNCVNLTQINYNATIYGTYETFVFYHAGQNTDGVTVNVGNNVTRIPERFLLTARESPISKIVELNLPGTLTRFPTSALFYCKQLRGSSTQAYINFDGTIAEFESIVVNENITNGAWGSWDGAGRFYVQCTDGITSCSLRTHGY